MKGFKNIIYLSIIVGLIGGCKKDITSPVPIVENDNSTAKLKIIYASAYTVRDSIQIKINDQRVSNTFIGISTTFTPTPFPGGGLNTGGSNFPYYLSLNPGDTKVFVSVPKRSSTIDSIIRFSGNVNLVAGKHYSLYITDTLLTARSVLVEENMVDVADGLSRFKFVNLIPNLPAIDLYFDTLKVASNVAYATVSPEFTLAYKAIGQLRIRAAGAPSSVTPFAVYPSGTGTFSVPNKRVMTIFAKGYNTGTVARTPTISLLYNR